MSLMISITGNFRFKDFFRFSLRKRLPQQALFCNYDLNKKRLILPFGRNSNDHQILIRASRRIWIIVRDVPIETKRLYGNRH